MYTVYDTDMYGKVLTGDGDFSILIENENNNNMSNIKKFSEFVNESLNEGSYSMNIGNAKEDKIAREYGAINKLPQMGY